MISNVFRILNILQWYLILTTLLLPEPPHPSPSSSCRPEDGPELAAHAPETATPETAENVESYVVFFLRLPHNAFKRECYLAQVTPAHLANL